MKWTIQIKLELSHCGCMPLQTSDTVVSMRVFPTSYSNRFMHDSEQMFVPDVMEFLCRCFWDIILTRIGNTWAHRHLDLWPVKSNQFITDSRWTVIPNVKIFLHISSQDRSARTSEDQVFSTLMPVDSLVFPCFGKSQLEETVPVPFLV